MVLLDSQGDVMGWFTKALDGMSTLPEDRPPRGSFSVDLKAARERFEKDQVENAEPEYIGSVYSLRVGGSDADKNIIANVRSRNVLPGLAKRFLTARYWRGESVKVTDDVKAWPEMDREEAELLQRAYEASPEYKASKDNAYVLKNRLRYASNYTLRQHGVDYQGMSLDVEIGFMRLRDELTLKVRNADRVIQRVDGSFKDLERFLDVAKAIGADFSEEYRQNEGKAAKLQQELDEELAHLEAQERWFNK